VPVANRFFDALGGELHDERPDGVDTERVFVALKGSRRGQPLSAEGLDEIRDSAPTTSMPSTRTCTVRVPVRDQRRRRTSAKQHHDQQELWPAPGT